MSGRTAREHAIDVPASTAACARRSAIVRTGVREKMIDGPMIASPM